MATGTTTPATTPAPELTADMDANIGKIKAMKAQENEYNFQMQKAMMEANINKTFSDALKASARNVSRMAQ